ncbi:hypothetical protein H9X57_06360 [Flavobacterium piscinae]|uniref:Gliding motility-associated protein GldM C-terminal domain-containing protein n=1 Tax=Flavobacterium piscinae TaxID=2506424 RepID=A0A4Q1KSA7_9FLAO|nr:hypothetical protein [Flavobacterium piscinae]MBC8883161.1 hypothetical protein [Flavobacterium piscinae]RXR33033.1 hypothetical protein EQG68_05945 [Flavobacterium piscinae]
MKNVSRKYLLLICFISILCQSQEIIKRQGFAVSVNAKFLEASMTKEEFKTATFGVHSFYPEMVGRVGLKGFTVKYTGQKEIVIKGNKLTDVALRGLSKLKRGDQITIYDAISKPDGNYLVEIRYPMIITIL